jgi:hypothetical protein
MKQFFISLFNKASHLIDEDLATRDRSTFFRVTIFMLVGSTVCFIIFYTIKSMG